MKLYRKAIGIYCWTGLLLFVASGLFSASLIKPKQELSLHGREFSPEEIDKLTSAPMSQDALNKAINMQRLSRKIEPAIEEYILQNYLFLDQPDLAAAQARRILKHHDSVNAHRYLLDYSIKTGNSRQAKQHLALSELKYFEKLKFHLKLQSLRGKKANLIQLLIAIGFLILGLLIVRFARKFIASRQALSITKDGAIPEKPSEAPPVTTDPTEQTKAQIVKPTVSHSSGEFPLQVTVRQSEQRKTAARPQRVSIKPLPLDRGIKENWFILAESFLHRVALSFACVNEANLILAIDYLKERKESISESRLSLPRVVIEPCFKLDFTRVPTPEKPFKPFVVRIKPYSITKKLPAKVPEKYKVTEAEPPVFSTDFQHKLLSAAAPPAAAFSIPSIMSGFSVKPVSILTELQNDETFSLPIFAFNPEKWADPVSEQNVNRLVREMQRNQGGSGLQLLAVTSCDETSNRTGFSFILGKAFAKSGQKTLIIDADFANPLLNLFTDVPCIYSLKHIFDRHDHDTRLVTDTEFANLAILPSGTPDQIQQKKMNEEFWHLAINMFRVRHKVIILILPAVKHLADLHLNLKNLLLITLKDSTSTASDREFKYWQEFWQKRGVNGFFSVNCKAA